MSISCFELHPYGSFSNALAEFSLSPLDADSRSNPEVVGGSSPINDRAFDGQRIALACWFTKRLDLNEKETTVIRSG